MSVAVQLPIEATLTQQVHMGALLDDPAVLHDADEIGIPDGSQSVGDDDSRSTDEKPLEGFLDQALSKGVNAGGRLVENQYLRVGERLFGAQVHSPWK